MPATNYEFKTIDDLVSTIISGSAEYAQIGRDFFAQNFDKDQKAIFLRYMIDEGLFEPLCEIVHTGCINRKTINPDSISGKKITSLDSRYFHLFLKMTEEAGLLLGDIMPLIVATFSAPKNSRLQKWNEAADSFLEREAQKDFGKVFALLTKYDKQYYCYEPLIRADKEETIESLVKRLLFEKHTNKAAIRRFLLGHKVEVTENLEVYQSSNVKVREAVVRLLLLFKHDNEASSFLDTIEESETSVSVMRLVNKEKAEQLKKLKSGKRSKAKKQTIKIDPVDELYDMMLSGRRIYLDEFFKKVDESEGFELAAETLFFALYKNDDMCEIAVFEKGILCNLDNKPLEFDNADTLTISVLHPSETPKKYDFILRLNISQVFNQINRKVYFATPLENSTGCCQRLKGNVANVKLFKAKLKRNGFKLFNIDTDGRCSAAGYKFGDFVCVMSFSSIDFDKTNEEHLTVGDVKFYRFGDLIKIGNRFYTETVPLVGASQMGSRVYSELLRAVYEVISSDEI